MPGWLLRHQAGGVRPQLKGWCATGMASHCLPRALRPHELRYRNSSPFWSMVLGRLVHEIEHFDVVHTHMDHFGYPPARVAPCPGGDHVVPAARPAGDGTAVSRV
jgi:hypothetical protein